MVLGEHSQLVVGGDHAGAVAEFLEDGQCPLVAGVGGVVVAPAPGEHAQLVVPGCLPVLIEIEASVLELPIGQFPLVIPSSNAIEDARGFLGGVVGLLDIARFAEVSIALNDASAPAISFAARCVCSSLTNATSAGTGGFSRTGTSGSSLCTAGSPLEW